MEGAMNGLFLLPGLICVFLGVVFLLFYRSYSAKQGVADRNITAKTWGKLTITRAKEQWQTENRYHTVYFGVYEYDTEDGQHITSSSGQGYYNPDDIPGAGGKMVNILYNPNKPTEYVIPEEQTTAISVWSGFKKTGITFIVIGILLTVLAAAGLLGLFNSLLMSLL